MTGMEIVAPAVPFVKPLLGPAAGQAFKLIPVERFSFKRAMKKAHNPEYRWLSRRERKRLIKAYTEDSQFRAALLSCTNGPREPFLEQLRIVLDAGRSDEELLDYGDVMIENFVRLERNPAVVTTAGIRGVKNDTETILDILASERPPTVAVGDIKNEAMYRAYLRTALQDPGLDRRIPLRAQVGSDAPVPASDLIPSLLDERQTWAVVAPGGAGKTTELRALARHLLEQGDEVIYLDLKRLDAESKQAATDTGIALNDLLNLTVLVPTPLDVLQRLSDEHAARVVWIADGFNELPTVAAESVLDLLRNQLLPSSVLVVSDRESRNYDKDERWNVVRLLEIDESSVREAVRQKFGEPAWQDISEARKHLLRLPFFLDLALRAPTLEDAASPAEAIDAFNREVLRLTPEQFEATARFALEIYLSRALTATPDAARRLGPMLLRHLLSSGTLQTTADGLEFRHQLLLDYFTASSLASRQSLWDIPTFDAVSLDANSLDVLLFVAEMLDDLALGDRYLTDLHDWNWNATTKCLAALGKAHDERISDGIVLAIWAMVAAKKYDVIHGSSKRATDRTRELEEVFQDRFAVRFTAARSMVELVAALETEAEALPHQGAWFQPWLETFVGAASNDQLAARLYNSNPLIGWAASNALRRRVLDATEQRRLRSAYQAALVDDSPLAASVRWRIVHSLAEWTSRENSELLLEAVNTDPYLWVQYGAIRGLVEMAARDRDGERPFILAGLSQAIPHLGDEPATQLSWAAMHEGSDTTWPDAIRPVLTEAAETATGKQQMRLRRKLEEFEQWVSGRGAISGSTA